MFSFPTRHCVIIHKLFYCRAVTSHLETSCYTIVIGENEAKINTVSLLHSVTHFIPHKKIAHTIIHAYAHIGHRVRYTCQNYSMKNLANWFKSDCVVLDTILPATDDEDTGIFYDFW